MYSCLSLTLHPCACPRILISQLEQSRSLRDNALLVSQSQESRFAAQQNLVLLRADLSVLEEVISCFSWHESTDDEEGGGRGNDEHTIKAAVKKINETAGTQEAAQNDVDIRGVRGVAATHGLGEDAVLVDKLVVEMERRRTMSNQICTRLLTQFQEQGLAKLEAVEEDERGAASGAVRRKDPRNRTVSTMDAPDNISDGDVLHGLETEMPPKNSNMGRRASAAQGRYR